MHTGVHQINDSKGQLDLGAYIAILIGDGEKEEYISGRTNDLGKRNGLLGKVDGRYSSFMIMSI